jgi:hypothetical protein
LNNRDGGQRTGIGGRALGNWCLELVYPAGVA